MSVSANSNLTFNDLEKLVDENTNGTINLPADSVIYFEHDIVVKKSLTINGNGIICTNGGFNVNKCKLVLSNFNFEYLTHHNTVQDGDLICNNSKFLDCYGVFDICSNSYLLLNNSKISYGSLDSQIKLKSGSRLYVNNSIFSDNVLLNRCGNNFGSCISGCADSVNINNSTFRGNQAAYGGALAFNNPSNYNVTISNCIVHNNFANASGGFLYTDGAGKYVVKLIKNDFQSNTANLDNESVNRIYGHGSCVLVCGSEGYEYFIENNSFRGNHDRGDDNFVKNAVLTVFGTNHKAVIHYTDDNSMDGTGVFKDYIGKFDCDYIKLDRY